MGWAVETNQAVCHVGRSFRGRILYVGGNKRRLAANGSYVPQSEIKRFHYPVLRKLFPTALVLYLLVSGDRPICSFVFV